MEGQVRNLIDSGCGPQMITATFCRTMDSPIVATMAESCEPHCGADLRLCCRPGRHRGLADRATVATRPAQDGACRFPVRLDSTACNCC
jgi:hypothetical protein